MGKEQNSVKTAYVSILTTRWKSSSLAPRPTKMLSHLIVTLSGILIIIFALS